MFADEDGEEDEELRHGHDGGAVDDAEPAANFS